MRLTSRIALALLLSPTLLAAQSSRDSIYAQDGFLLTIPAGYSGPVRNTSSGALDAWYWAGKNSVLMVAHPSEALVTPPDTTLATLRGLMLIARNAMLRASQMQAGGDPSERVSDDRFVMRIPILSAPGAQRQVYGVTEFSIARHGPSTLWMVGYLGVNKADVGRAEVGRLLESFSFADAGAVTYAPDSSDIFTWLNGPWMWSRPTSAGMSTPFILSVAPDRGSVRLEYPPGSMPDSVGPVTYRVLGHGEQWLRGRIEGETRKTDAGEPVEWDFVRMGRDHFCWRRGDWAEGQCTAPLQRLSPPAPPAPRP